MRDPAVPAIFEAAFEHDGIRIRVDVMERLPGEKWGLREVKSSTRLKEHYLDDIALQAYVVRNVGVNLASVQLLHVNNAYVRGPGGIDWPQYFARTDLQPDLSDVPYNLPAMRACLALPAEPDVEPGDHCHTPYPCEFLDRCTADKPQDWIANLPYLRAPRAAALKALGIEAISQIPADFPLSANQAMIRDVTATGVPFVSPDLGKVLRNYGPPACYLDFEAMMPAIPLYEGTSPYQTIPFQWSLHADPGDGTLHHREFLAQGDTDPRRRFAETLIAALAAFNGPVITYSHYEKTRLRELAAEFPDLAVPLRAISARLADLLQAVRNVVYLQGFRFDNSIKSVAPALCPGFGYDDLPLIADGNAASAAFVRLASGGITAEEGRAIRSALLQYCHRDTMATVVTHRALKELAGGVPAKLRS
jgi:hypothetical protein